jgi:hypothetical protein
MPCKASLLCSNSINQVFRTFVVIKTSYLPVDIGVLGVCLAQWVGQESLQSVGCRIDAKPFIESYGIMGQEKIGE